MSAVSLLLALPVLLVGASLLWLFSEMLEGKEESSLHFGNVLLATVVGLALFPFWGWISTGLVLAFFGALWILAAFVARLR